MRRRDGRRPGSRVRVTIANPWFYPLVKGPAERFRRYGTGLSDRGVDLRVFTVRRQGLSRTDVVDGIRVERVSVDGSIWSDRTFVYSLLRRFWRRDGRPEVFQLFTYQRMLVPFVVALRSLGIPTILVFTLLSRSTGSRVRRRLRRWYHRWLFEPFDVIVTSSGVMTAELRDLGVRRPRIVKIPNGVDLARFRPPRDGEAADLRRELELPTEGEIVLFVGSIYPRKGVDVLLEAWEKLSRRHPDASLVLVGSRHEDEPKYDAFREKVDRLVARAVRPERVLFPGLVDNVEEYMRAADVFAFPSLREGMPNVVPEAMATGLPCVVTPFKGLPEEFGEPGQEYVLADRRPEALAEAIGGLMASDRRRREIGDRARRWTEGELDVQDSLDRYAELYHQIARTSRAGDDTS